MRIAYSPGWLEFRGRAPGWDDPGASPPVSVIPSAVDTPTTALLVLAAGTRWPGMQLRICDPAGGYTGIQYMSDRAAPLDAVLISRTLPSRRPDPVSADAGGSKEDGGPRPATPASLASSVAGDAGRVITHRSPWLRLQAARTRPVHGVQKQATPRGRSHIWLVLAACF